MEQTIHPVRSGWRPEETDMLWQEIRAAAETGEPLRGVFERMGRTLGRKPNSVRNYYYMQLRDQAGEELKRAAPFETFSQDEVHDLLRSVLMARGKGRSVRACVMELSGGDRALMLRYQNKYRSILRKKPALIQQVCRELQSQGLPCPMTNAEETETAAPLSAGIPLSSAQDPDVRTLLTALESLAQRAGQNAQTGSDRLKVQRDLLLMQLEDLQLACRALIADCKDFLGGTSDERRLRLSAFCASLSSHIARLESMSG